MKKITFFILFLSFVFSQSDSVDVTVVYNHPELKVRQFELALIKKVISIYNGKNKQKLKGKYLQLDEKNGVWYYLYDKAKEKSKDLVCGLTSGTYEANHPHVDFSIPYIPVKLVVLGKKDGNKLNKNKNYRLGYINSVSARKALSYIFENYRITKIPVRNYEQLYSMLQEDKIDLYYADSIDEWIYDGLEIKYTVKNKTTYMGFVFQKNSLLKPKFDSILKYYVKSPAFYQLLKKYFGKDLQKYYKKTYK
jgi:ABC-type amino acid transport substrate-binding protein